MWWKKSNRKGPGAGKTYEQKFWEQIELSNNGCWEWQGSKTPENYGTMGVQGKVILAHRMSYEMNIGEIPDGFLVCHHCDNPLCVNPDHLFVGTQQDNQRDKVEKGRQAKGESHGYYKNPEAVSQGENHHKAKLTKQDAINIRERFATGKVNRQTLAQEYNVNWSTINRLIRMESWKGLDGEIPQEILNQPKQRGEKGQWI